MEGLVEAVPKRGDGGHFGRKTGMDFAHFGLELSMVYKGTTVVYQCVRHFNSK